MHDTPEQDHDPEMAGRHDHDAPRILVVDDDTVHRMVICRIAAKVGYEPVEAASYDDAERLLLAGGTFACISLDLALGRRGGIDVMRLIADYAKRTPVIIISGGDAGCRADADALSRRLGLNSYESLPKPVNLADLKQRLGQIKLRTEAGLNASQRP
ncbi:response regulator [Xanthobacteraceae bacterium Astr-EGSB]|uniref:response regulator n=1 Tax=Astrobacterium formosum TaxID=3069710 RepID=UPI0027B7A00B|nr:response regulator [Xanthobacteraceae bacterium Astr-EGSB]